MRPGKVFTVGVLIWECFTLLYKININTTTYFSHFLIHFEQVCILMLYMHNFEARLAFCSFASLQFLLQFLLFFIFLQSISDLLIAWRKQKACLYLGQKRKDDSYLHREKGHLKFYNLNSGTYQNCLIQRNNNFFTYIYTKFA